jgi:hypothetical protein
VDKAGLVYKIKLRPKRFIKVKDKDIPISPGNGGGGRDQDREKTGDRIFHLAFH